MEPELSKEKLYDSIIEGHPYAFFIVDKDLKIREFNPAAEKLTGWQKGEVIGKSYSEILKSDICEEDSPFIEPSQGKRTCIGQDTAIKTKSGQEVAVLFSATSFWNDGQFTGGLGIFIEATEIKKAEIRRQNIISIFTHDLKAPLAIAGAYLFRVIDGKAGELTDRQMQYRCKDKGCHITGAGLGLAIVKGIIESHGGKIWAKSVLGKGTSFFFTIPKTEKDEVI
jgi:PAS domain S-box-containing protein